MKKTISLFVLFAVFCVGASADPVPTIQLSKADLNTDGGVTLKFPMASTWGHLISNSETTGPQIYGLKDAVNGISIPLIPGEKNVFILNSSVCGNRTYFNSVLSSGSFAAFVTIGSKKYSLDQLNFETRDLTEQAYQQSVREGKACSVIRVSAILEFNP